MAENSAISWTDHTFNPWVGCTKVSPACDHCYAEGWAKRAGSPQLWTGERRRTTAANWQKPLKWNREAERLGIRYRVFCASLADVFDNQVPAEWRADLWELIAATPHLDWQLLTKRPQNIRKMLPASWASGWPNVWLGTTAENQTEADRRVPHLLKVPAAVRFISAEPLLGPIDFGLGRGWCRACGTITPGTIDGHCMDPSSPCFAGETTLDAMLHWIIVGGESGSGARPMQNEWAQSIVDQCRAAGVAAFVKQLSSGSSRAVQDIDAFPESLRVREWPHA